MEQNRTPNAALKSKLVSTKKTESDNRFSYNLIKGKIAEETVHRLFAVNNYNVFNFGMENTIPGILGTLDSKNSTAARIRLMPDLVVQKPNSTEVFFIEVKYRKEGVYKMEQKYRDYAYAETQFIIVSKTNFKVVSYDKLSQDGRVTEHNSSTLKEAFQIGEESEKFFLEIIAKFYQGVD